MARTRITKNPDNAAPVASWTKNVANAKNILKKAIPQVGKITSFSAANSLQCAIITNSDHLDEDTRANLSLIIGKYIK